MSHVREASCRTVLLTIPLTVIAVIIIIITSHLIIATVPKWASCFNFFCFLLCGFPLLINKAEFMLKVQSLSLGSAVEVFSKMCQDVGSFSSMLTKNQNKTKVIYSHSKHLKSLLRIMMIKSLRNSKHIVPYYQFPIQSINTNIQYVASKYVCYS